MTVCGYKGDPVCFPPNCQGACPTNKPDLRPEREKKEKMTDQDILDIATLIHRKWADAMTNLLKEKKSTDDGSPDWEDFHRDRLQHATKEVDYWDAVKYRFLQEHPLDLKKMGL